jgi:hypothetical protein
MDTISRSAFTKSEFCRRNGISKSFFYKIRKQGRGPREMLGRITAEAERDWQHEREAEAAAKQINQHEGGLAV